MTSIKSFKLIRLGFLLLTIAAMLLVAPGLLGSQAEVAHPVHKAPVKDALQNAFAVRVAQAANVAIDLCASDGTLALPGGATVAVWGFVDTGGGACTTGLANSLPGPELRVNDGDSVTINLTNALAENVSILIPGQNLTSTGGVSGEFSAEAGASGGTVTYNFTAQEGSYLYESGSNASIQIPMGLYGALIVDSGIAGQAYGHAIDEEAVLLLSEIDPNLNANPGGFDLLTYHPTYWLINGTGYPNTTPITANPGDQVLLRYLNAGFDHPSMALLGAYQRVIAKDSYTLANAFDATAEIIPAGTTADMMVDTTSLDGSYPLYNRNMYVTNAEAYPGGMLTFINVAAPVGSPPTIQIISPASGSTVFGDTVAVQIDANDAEDAAGSLVVEWRVDSGAWQMASWSGSYYEANWDTTLSSDGAHTLNARATDSDGNGTSSSNGVVVSNAPVVSVVAPAEGATIFGDTVLVQIDASDAEDASLTVMWGVDGDTSQTAIYNGVSGYYEANLDSTGLADGAHTINAQATDSRTIDGSDSNNISVSNLPSLTIVNPADGTNVFGQVTVRIDATDAEDDAGGAGSLIVTWDIDGGATQSAAYNAGTGYYEANWDTTSLATPNHTIHARMTDSRGNPASDSNNVTITPPNSIHIGDLDDASVQAGGPNWSARVTVAVHDINHAAVAGATVHMDVTRTSKTDGSTVTEDLSCVTGANGLCTIARTVNENQFENNVTFSVTTVTNPPADPYDSSLNHDPDGESDGTTLVVGQP
jgi:FtsP/CotA-like multicopper oxidase with cupredoxin domain